MADYRRGDTAGWDKEQVRRAQSSSAQRRSAPQRASDVRPAQSVRRKKKKRRMNPLLKVLL